MCELIQHFEAFLACCSGNARRGKRLGRRVSRWYAFKLVHAYSNCRASVVRPSKPSNNTLSDCR